MRKKQTGKAILGALAALSIAGAAEASIFGPVYGTGWDINHDGKKDIGDWSIFGPVSGTGWSIFGPVSGTGWSIFGPVSGTGWNIDCLFNCSGNFGLAAARAGAPVLVARPAAPSAPMVMPMVMMPQMQMRPAGGLPAGVVQCSFSDDVTLLAKSVSDCEAAGGEVQQSAAAQEGSGSDENDG